MMKSLIFASLILLLSNCHKFPNNQLDSDEELKHKPEIVHIETDSYYNLVLYLDYSYSEQSTIIAERKTKGGFERISYLRFSQTVLVDTTFDKELDANFIYRLYVEKNGCRSNYSNEKPFDYVSSTLNVPAGLKTEILELQGIKLAWRDRSRKEDGYKIEKNDGKGWSDLASLPPNSQAHFDVINITPDSSMQLSYRVKAYNSALSSQWSETQTSYSGISAPSNLQIADTTAFQFTIQWQDNSNVESSYSIERSKNGGPFAEIGYVNSNIIRYVDKITEIGKYNYRVRAKKDKIYSMYSNEVAFNIKTTVPTLGLVSYYPFDGNALDASGKNNHGVVYNASLTSDRFGKTNKAYSFNGNSYIKASATNLPSGQRTTSLWFYTSSVTYGQVMLAYGGNSTWGPGTTWFVGIDGNSYYMSCHFSSYEIRYYYSQKPVGAWYHFVVTTDVGGTKIFINGEQKASNTTFVNNTYVNGKDLSIGVDVDKYGTAPYTDGNVGYFVGKIDDIRIYDRALNSRDPIAIS